MKKGLFFLTLAFIFAGCDVYESGFDTSTIDVDECIQSGGLCDQPGVGAGIELSIEGPGVLRPQSAAPTCVHDSTKYCFDVAGKCNTDGHPISRIEVQSVVNTANQNSQSFQVLNAPITCYRGRFWLQLALDNVPCTIRRATLELIAEDTVGNAYRNPARAVQTIDMLVQRDPVCP